MGKIELLNQIYCLEYRENQSFLHINKFDLRLNEIKAGLTLK